MNSRPFDRKTVERYVHNGYLIPDFMEKYEFDSETEFRDNLIRIFSDTGKVDRMLQDMRKKEKKEKKRQKKNVNAPINAALNIQTAPFVPVQTQNLNVPYNSKQITSIMDGVTANPLDNLKVNTFEMPAKEEVVEVNQLDVLKADLAKNNEFLFEIESRISDLEIQRATIYEEVNGSKERIAALRKQFEDEKNKVESLSKEFETCENNLAADNDLRQKTVEEIRKIEESIKSLETKKLYFGNNFSDSYDYDSSKYEVLADEVMKKMTELLSAGDFEEFAVSEVRAISRILCIIDKAVAEDENIEICFEGEKETIVDAVRIMTELNVMVIE
ncbi:MAG: hypothetical protein IKN65_03650 [Clostridia bacterium]|nr:hypothetical protein [Clostridia bacterium]